MALVMTLAPAGHAATPPDAEITAALKRHGDGTWTQADVNLIRSIPELAAVVEDVTRPEEITTVSAPLNSAGQPMGHNGAPMGGTQASQFMPPADAEPAIAGETVIAPVEDDVDPDSSGVSPMITGGTWKMTHITHTHRSYSGSIIFKYHTYAEFNYGGGKVRALRERYDDFTNTNSVDVKIAPKCIVDTKSSTPANSGSSQMKREADLCVFKYGCYATLHPWAEVKVYGTGRTAIGGSGV
ncbi:hypothetical protein [Streptomyces fagopyri]|uniref:hypothetical protein n=1 Tax=Streptomyces fagopyri TaxID=2662397 RepID=UPI00382DA133